MKRNGMKLLRSSFQFELFVLAFLVCVGIIWFTIIWKQDFVIFTDPETGPEPTDFIAELPGYVQSLWTR